MADANMATFPALPPRPARRRRPWLLAVGLLVAVSAGGYAWYSYTAPRPPEIDLSGAEPAVAEMVETARQAVLRAPRSGAAWGELGLVLDANGYRAPAQLCFAHAEYFDPEAPIWPYLQGLRLLVSDREAAVPLLRRAVVRADQQDPITATPHLGTPHLMLAEVLFAQDHVDEAASLCRQVLTQDPENPRAHFNLGLIALAADDLEGSIRHLSSSAMNAFSGKRSCLFLATAYQRLGDPASAAECRRRADQLPPERRWPDPYTQQVKKRVPEPQRHQQQAEALAQAGRPGEALIALRGLAEEADTWQSHYRLGIALYNAGDFHAAEPVMRTALRRSPELFGSHFLLGVILLQQGEAIIQPGGAPPAAQGKFREAEERLRHSTELRPAHGRAHLFLGQALRRLGRDAEALVEFRAAVQCQPDLADAHFDLGEALAAAGQPAAARYHLEHARALAPADARPGAALARLRGSAANP